jgi:membrane protease YdiL (CAAX protease family)
MDEKSKKMKRMAIWAFAVFAAVFAIVMAVLWIPLYNGGASAVTAIGQAFAAGWVFILVVAVLCIGTYFGYKVYLNNKK